jgi:di/tripeptidase
MEKKVLTQEEIAELKELKETFTQLTEVAGVVEMQSLNIKIKKEQLKLNLQDLQQKEATLARTLEEKYGKGTISLESGEFLPSK